jgi:hypothetical protein
LTASPIGPFRKNQNWNRSTQEKRRFDGLKSQGRPRAAFLRFSMDVSAEIEFSTRLG